MTKTTVAAVSRSQRMRRTSLPRVLVLTTGGTIQGTARSRVGAGLADYEIGGTSSAQLFVDLPELASFARLKVEALANVDSAIFDLSLLCRLHERIATALASTNPPAGIVITHGTDTLEETAYFLNLTLRTTLPIILTGSMRPATALSPDGPLNLCDAVRVAADTASASRGVLVVINGRIHAARDVIKTSARGTDTFQSPDTGPLGVVDPDVVRFYRRPDYRHTRLSQLLRAPLAALPRVDVIASYQEAGREAFDAAVTAGARGLILADPLTPALKAAVRDTRNIVAVLANRGIGGRVRMEGEFHRLGILQADHLPPRKARILLRLALSLTEDRQKLQRILEEH